MGDDQKKTPVAGQPQMHVIQLPVSPAPHPSEVVSLETLDRRFRDHAELDQRELALIRDDVAEVRKDMKSITARQTGVLGIVITIATGIAAIVHALISG